MSKRQIDSQDTSQPSPAAAPTKQTPISEGINAAMQGPQQPIVIQEVHHQKVSSFHGPLPAPEDLERYESIHPGFAEQIMTMAVNEQGHRHKYEGMRVTQEIENHKARNKEATRGQYFGLFIGLAAIGCGTYLAAIGQEWVGGFLGTGGVIGLVAVFVFGRLGPLKKEKTDQK